MILNRPQPHPSVQSRSSIYSGCYGLLILTQRRFHLWLILIILLALAIRCYNLTYHSLWFDEAVSVHWARQSVPRILEVGFTLIEDRLPPLYYLTLKGWAALFGFSETSVRLLSVFFGVLLVPVSAKIGQLLFNRRVALLTALLVTLNPFLIWYAQEARMYAPAVLFGALTVLALLQMIKFSTGKIKSVSSPHPPNTNYQLLITNFFFILFATASLYSHLYAGFLLPALGLWLIISYPRAWGLWLRFALSGLIISLAFAPIALAIWQFSGEATPGDPLNGLGQRVWWLLHAFTVWQAVLPFALQVAIPTITLIFALSAYLPYRRNNLSLITNYQLLITNPRLLTTLLLLTPFLIASLLLTRNYLAFFGERYFIVMVPWLLLLVALGTDNLIRFTFYVLRKQPPLAYAAAALILLIPILATLLPVPGQWRGPATKEFWRQSVDYLADNAEPDHGILIHPDWVRYPFQYYFRGPGQTYAAFSDVGPDTPLDGPLQGVVGEHPIIWLIQSHIDSPDPDRLVEQWFASRYPLVTELYPPGVTLKGYAPGYQMESLPPTATPVDLEFGNGLKLVGYQADASVSATDTFFHPPSGWVHVTLYWTANGPITADPVPYVRLVGPAGVWGVNLERSNDALKLYPPARWPTDGSLIIRHDLDVNLNPATPPGRYQLVVGFQKGGEQQPLTAVEVR